MGQHFFFNAGNGIGEILSGVGSLNRLAFHVPAEKFDEYRKKLKGKGVRVGPVLNHDESPAQVSATLHPGVYVRSFYFQDPDGIMLEFACWIKEFDESDVVTVPKTAADRRPPVAAAH
jgi:catechol 2,3-dioxygenase-like lactoylglutathione lyase family enzyme